MKYLMGNQACDQTDAKLQEEGFGCRSNIAGIPGIRAGKNTADYINKVLKNVTWCGAIFLALVAVLPVACQAAMPGLALSFGGTTILIVVSVALETLKTIETQMVSRHYDGFLD